MADKVEVKTDEVEVTNAEGEALSDKEAQEFIEELQNSTMCLSQRR